MFKKLQYILFIGISLVFISSMEAKELYTQSSEKDDIHRHHVHEQFTKDDEHGFADGLSIEAAVTTDFLRNVSGGVTREGTILGNLDLIIDLDTQKSGLWDDGEFFVYFLGNANSNGTMTAIAGDFQTSSNIEAISAFRVYEFWYQHKLTNNLSLLVGLHDYNSEFNSLEYASLFINSSFGIEADISQVGPSIFPVASLATRIAYKPSKNTYILAAIYDGVSGDSAHPRRAAIQFKDGDGLFSAIEAGFTDGESHDAEYYKIALGLWHHSARVDNFAGVEDNNNKGIYMIGEKTIFSTESESLGGFFQLGFADSSRNQIGTYIGAGLNYKGLFSKRGDDLLGLAVAHARNSSDYKAYQLTQGTSVDSAETSIELTYEAEIYPWLIVQPNIQYIVNPSMDKTLNNATVVGVRMTLVY